MKINYLIAACSYRANRDSQSCINGVDILKLHLQELSKTDLSLLDRITLIRALPLIRNDLSMSYWDLQNVSKNVLEKLLVVDVPDMYFSYSSWIQDILLHGKDFDYSILIEDDYYPAHVSFVRELVRIHQKKLSSGGYLCGFATDHAAVSNGIIDNKTLLNSLKIKPNWQSILSQGAQVHFSTDFFGENLADYTDDYRCLFWNNTPVNMKDNGKKIDLINPIQCLDPKIAELVK